MNANVKRYSVVIRGRVQDIGFKDLVAEIANFLRLRGYVFNDVDGDVKIIVEGAKNTIESFLEDLKAKTRSAGIEIEGIDKKEASIDFELPPKFVKIATTELEEIGKKLDIGINILRELRNGQENLANGQETVIESQATLVKGQEDLVKGQEVLIKGQEILVKGQEDLISGQVVLVNGQEKIVKTQEKMLAVLERIEFKL